MLWYPNLFMLLEVRPHQCRAEWDNSLSCPAAVLGQMQPRVWLAILAARAPLPPTRTPDPLLWSCSPGSRPGYVFLSVDMPYGICNICVYYIYVHCTHYPTPGAKGIFNDFGIIIQFFLGKG